MKDKVYWVIKLFDRQWVQSIKTDRGHPLVSGNIDNAFCFDSEQEAKDFAHIKNLFKFNFTIIPVKRDTTIVEM